MFSTIEFNARGNGGNVELNANSLSVTNGAGINTGTAGNGNAGDIIIAIADSVVLDGTAFNGLFSSGLGSDVSFTAQGNGGNINLTANSLAVRNRALISAISLGQGNAGNVDLNLEESVALEQGFIATLIHLNRQIDQRMSQTPKQRAKTTPLIQLRKLKAGL